jgi:hypothetical protein
MTGRRVKDDPPVRERRSPMNLKKMIAVLIAVALLVSLAGCGSLIRKVVEAAEKPETSAGEPEPAGSGGKTEKPPKNTAKPTKDPKTTEDPGTVDVPGPSQAPELTPEEEFFASMIGDYRFVQIGLGGDNWGATWLYEEQRLEEERIAATEPAVSLRADGTGTLVFDGERHDLTWRFDPAELNYVKETGLPGSYSDVFRLDDGGEVIFSYSARILTFDYKDWVSVYTTMTEAEYEAYLAAFNELPEAVYRLGEPRIINTVESGGGYVNQKVFIPVYNSGRETFYMRDMHLVIRDTDGTVVYDTSCYGRNPDVLRPGEDGAFIEWVNSNWFQNGYTSLSPDMTVELDDIVIYPMNEEYIHRMPLSDVYLDRANGCVNGTIHNDTGEFVAGWKTPGEEWGNPRYSYSTQISCYGADGTLLYSKESYETEGIEAGQTRGFSAQIVWLPEGYTYDDIDHVKVWAYILDYEYTEKR